jgi:rhodanese-related sulfurtransferase
VIGAAIDPTSLFAALQDGSEIALIDPRQEGRFGTSHLLLAVNVPLSRLELLIGRLIPRRSTRIVLTDDGGGVAEQAAVRLGELGYSRVEILAGGISAWRTAGFELFSGMSVPGKAFGEWIAVTCQTPCISAEDLQQMLVSGDDVIVLDSRPANEYQNMNIPGSINVPVSELVYRFGELPVILETLVVVNCAGRTRSLIGAQTLIDAGIPNRVAALRGGTMAWQLAGFALEHCSTRHAPEPWGKNLETAVQRASAVAERFGVTMIDETTLATYKAERERRSLYVIDVRTPDEFRSAHRPDSFHAWGVQLVQSLDKYVATRNSRIVLVDNYLVRAQMTAAWLKQTGRPETYVLADPFQGVVLESGVPASDAAGHQSEALPPVSGLDTLTTRNDDIFRMPFLWGHFTDDAEFETAAADYLEWELQLPEQIHRSGEIAFSRDL